MEIAANQLSREALLGIIEEFVTREGTEYGERLVPLAAKVREVEAQILRGDVWIDFDPVTETVDLRSRDRSRPAP